MLQNLTQVSYMIPFRMIRSLFVPVVALYTLGTVTFAFIVLQILMQPLYLIYFDNVEIVIE